MDIALYSTLQCNGNRHDRREIRRRTDIYYALLATKLLTPGYFMEVIYNFQPDQGIKTETKCSADTLV
ncbi:hypothetical protein B5X24_HaOG203084 [Helicoverpa armigera]|uniref:Uncharacterized protein n=1 Tax=Helicoverpa armigera TaxID=29058 RepID=A0A2W1BWZ4_HELAM|nr:hypothetical protein B5X24_HaOG203084 [Helicoverpa armigera]